MALRSEALPNASIKTPLSQSPLAKQRYFPTAALACGLTGSALSIAVAVHLFVEDSQDFFHLRTALCREASRCRFVRQGGFGGGKVTESLGHGIVVLSNGSIHQRQCALHETLVVLAQLCVYCTVLQHRGFHFDRINLECLRHHIHRSKRGQTVEALRGDIPGKLQQNKLAGHVIVGVPLLREASCQAPASPPGSRPSRIQTRRLL